MIQHEPAVRRPAARRLDLVGRDDQILGRGAAGWPIVQVPAAAAGGREHDVRTVRRPDGDVIGRRVKREAAEAIAVEQPEVLVTLDGSRRNHAPAIRRDAGTPQVGSNVPIVPNSRPDRSEPGEPARGWPGRPVGEQPCRGRGDGAPFRCVDGDLVGNRHWLTRQRARRRAFALSASIEDVVVAAADRASDRLKRERPEFSAATEFSSPMLRKI